MRMRRRNQHVVSWNSGAFRSLGLGNVQELSRQHATIDHDNCNARGTIVEDIRASEKWIDVVIRRPLFEHAVNNHRKVRRCDVQRVDPHPQRASGRRRLWLVGIDTL